MFHYPLFGCFSVPSAVWLLQSVANCCRLQLIVVACCKSLHSVAVKIISVFASGRASAIPLVIEEADGSSRKGS